MFIHGNDASVIEAGCREHSRKPEEFYALVEATSPGSRVELFAREQRDGWRAFGNQTNKFARSHDSIEL
jgi:N6-adenosine-specific RNA methylase IME4